MSSIPTFNGGDLLKDVRENSLNPAIIKINELDTTVTSVKAKVGTLETAADKSVTEITQPAKGQLQITHGDTSKHLITLQDSGSGVDVDTSDLDDSEVITWDSKLSKFKPAGIYAKDGELRVSSGSVSFGNHKMSSSVSNVTFHNTDTGKNYTFVWQEQKPGSKTGYIRAIGEVEEVVRIPKGTDDVTNPVNKKITIDKDETFFGGSFILSQDAKQVYMEIHDEDGHVVWVSNLGDLSSGDNDVTFQVPFDMRKGYQYDIYLKSREGDVVAKGILPANEFSWTAKRAPWIDKEVASMKQDSISTGAVPVWNNEDKELIENHVKVTPGGGLQVSAEGIQVGPTKITPSANGVTFNPLLDLYSYKPLLQAVEEDSNTIYARTYRDSENFEVNTKLGKEIENPIVPYTPSENVVLTAITYHLVKEAAFVKISIFTNSTEIATFIEPNVGVGQHRYLVEDATDLKGNTTYSIAITGTNKDGSAGFKLEGDTLPYLVLETIPWVDEEIATRMWVSDTINGVVGGKEKFEVKRFSDATYAPDNTLFFNQKTMFVYTGSGESTLTIPSSNNPSQNKEGTYLLLKNESSDRSNLVIEVPSGGIGAPNSLSFTLPVNTVIMLFSDTPNNLWIPIILQEGTTPKVLREGEIVKNIGPTASGKQLLVTYYDDTSVTVAFEPWVADINKLNDAVDKLQRQLKSKTKNFVYKGNGDPLPTISKGIKGGYYFTFLGLTKDLDIPTPKVTGNVPDGAIFFIDNNSNTYSITVSAAAGETVSGQSKITILPESVAWFVRNGNNWQELYSGYLPSSHKALVNEIKTLIAADNTFMRDIGVQSDDPSTSEVTCSGLEFKGCKVYRDQVKPDRGIVEIEGTVFTNPSGSQVTTNRLKLVGMEIVDPGDGTPPKLLLLGDHNLPNPHPTSAYAFYSASADTPSNLDFNSMPVFRGGRVTLHKDTTDPEYAYIMLPPGEGTDAERVGELGGLPSYWAKSSKTYNIGGVVRTYTVFRSPYPFKEQDLTLIIYP